jgi:hypothetical protein
VNCGIIRYFHVQVQWDGYGVVEDSAWFRYTWYPPHTMKLWQQELRTFVRHVLILSPNLGWLCGGVNSPHIGVAGRYVCLGPFCQPPSPKTCLPKHDSPVSLSLMPRRRRPQDQLHHMSSINFASMRGHTSHRPWDVPWHHLGHLGTFTTDSYAPVVQATRNMFVDMPSLAR